MWKFGGIPANFVSINCKNLLLTFWKVKHCKGGRGGGSTVGGPKAATSTSSSNKKSSNKQQNQEQHKQVRLPVEFCSVLLKGGPRRAGGPKFRAFFPRPPLFYSFILSRRGFTRRPENSKRAHLRVPTLQSHHQNSTKRPPEEREKERKLWREREKRAKFWAVRRRGSSGGGVRGRAQIFDAPTKMLNTHRTDTPTHHTTQREIPHKAVLGKGGPSQGGPWPKKNKT